jgi:DNA-binding GntR family transcriptional regulator
MDAVYNVSTTTAVDDRAESLPDAGERPTEAQRVYLTLKREILAGRFRPGEPLQEVRIATQYGASRTPVREAFFRLSADGLLEMTPRRGATVKQPTIRDFLDVNELRGLLEPVAARMAALSIPAGEIAALIASHAAIARDRPLEPDFIALEELDRRMHATIAASLTNRRIAGILDGMNDMMQIVRQRDMRERHTELHDSIGDILGALARHESEAAEQLMRRHVEDFGGVLPRLV